MPKFTRRRVLSVTAGACLGLSAAGCVTAQSSGTARSVALERIAGGFTSPLGFESPDGVDRHYVVDQAGTVEAIADGGTSTFLDVTDRMVDVGGYTERGLLGLAFHPDFPETDRCYVRYSAPRRDGTPRNYSHTFVLSEFRATPDAADPASERTLLEIPQPQSNHNSGAVAFGPDGYCYVGVGDGGGANDTGRGHVEDWYGGNAGGNGQDVTENLLGSVLRVDVDGRSDGNPYAVPEDNPLVGREGLDEHYAWGLRNPWRFSFDGDRLIVADVGQNRFEEVDVVERGGNYGWNVREAAHCFSASSPGNPPDSCPDATSGDVRGGEPLRDPVVEYSHDRGIAVVGGYVYRGEAMPGLRGQYLFGDWQGTDGGPTVFAATPTDEGQWPMERLAVESDASPGSRLLAFGRDPAGELYVCTSERGTVGGSTGEVYRLHSPGGADPGTTADGPTATTTGGGSTGTPTDGGETATPTDTSTTEGDGSPPPGTTETGGQSGLGVLVGLLGAAGAVGYRYVRRGEE
jgi:glucose/arabinose dehydrogenase